MAKVKEIVSLKIKEMMWEQTQKIRELGDRALDGDLDALDQLVCMSGFCCKPKRRKK